MTRKPNPGDIVFAGFNASKIRPWLVLWVDDDHEEACVAAITRAAEYPGIVQARAARTGTINRVASWVSLVPLDRVVAARRVGVVDPGELARVTAQIKENLGFGIF